VTTETRTGPRYKPERHSTLCGANRRRG
jgi:hypothetical protein